MQNVIVDARDNGGGEMDFVSKGICPTLFNYDTECVVESVFPKKDYLENFYNNEFYRKTLKDVTFEETR